ncbi:GNAT family N-acetyltransferase [Endothiovibrio diazotrophicus]
MSPAIAFTDEEIAACWPVMRELRPHLEGAEFVARIRLQEAEGYRLAFLREGGAVVAVAGFRVGENLAWGRFLYVDDLVTSGSHRSRGFGGRLLAWLRRYAVEAGCRQLHLDSGMQREAAHRFYEREGMAKGSFHFVESLDSQP